MSAAAAALAVLVLSGIGTNPLTTMSGVNVAGLPESKVVTSSEYTVPAESFTMVSESYEVSPVVVDAGSASMNPEFILPLSNTAFAIPSTDLTVTSDEWTVPTASSFPFGITADSSDNIYFTESSSAGNKIGRLVPGTNVITEWTVPTASSAPFDITADSSDNIYFTESSSAGNKIGRLVPGTNIITEWTIPTASSVPLGITADSSDNIYFTERDGNNIGRLS